jgi:hypothetical protein
MYFAFEDDRTYGGRHEDYGVEARLVAGIWNVQSVQDVARQLSGVHHVCENREERVKTIIISVSCIATP